jgi:hypothetical protein
MTIIDFTAQMAPVGVGAVALLMMGAVGIASCLDDRERTLLRDAARRVGAWWAGRHAAHRLATAATIRLADASAVRRSVFVAPQQRSRTIRPA